MQTTAETKISLQQHPLSAAFPSMPAQEIAALALDLEQHGQREPGVMFEGMVLDGWHRYLACEMVDLPFKAEQYAGEDPVAFVISQNLHRRHLTASQRAASVVAASKWQETGRPGKGEPGSPFSTNASMAKAAEVTERTIQHAKVAHEAGLGDAVREGMLSAKDAAAVANGTPPQRPAPKTEKAPADAAKLKARIAELEEQAERQAEALAELVDTDKSAEAFKGNKEFEEMQVIRVELRTCKKSRDEFMRQCADLKKQVAHWRNRAEKAEKGGKKK